MYVVSMVSQFLNALCDSHWDAVTCILRYIKSVPGRGRCMKTKAIPTSFLTLMLIELGHHQVGDLPLGTMFLLEVI